MTRNARPVAYTVVGLTATAAALTGVVATAPPAHAETVTFTDARGDLKHPADLQWVKVTNGKEKLKVVAKIRDIHPTRHNQSAQVYLDTDPTDGGPEYRLAGGLTDGTDYALTRTERWKPANRVRWVKCHYSWRVDWDTNRVRAVMDNNCFRNADTFRVAASSHGQNPRPDGTVSGPVFTDWLGEAPRTWSKAVSRGLGG